MTSPYDPHHPSSLASQGVAPQPVQHAPQPDVLDPQPPAHAAPTHSLSASRPAKPQQPPQQTQVHQPPQQLQQHMPQSSKHANVLETEQARIMGRIIAVSGSAASIQVEDDLVRNGDPAALPLIGGIMVVDMPRSVVLCLVKSMNSYLEAGHPRQTIEVELVGELRRAEDGYIATFKRGITDYPRLGDPVLSATPTILAKAYQYAVDETMTVGTLRQNGSIPAVVRVDELLAKHFAIVGSTGSGKSCSVALLLRLILDRHPNGHIILLDPHGEYGECFGARAERLEVRHMDLPHWVLNFEETVEILIGDGTKYDAEVEILRDAVQAAKRKYGQGTRANNSLYRTDQKATERYSVDVPVPYRIHDVIGFIQDEMGKLEKAKEITTYRRLKGRIESIVQDPRYAFMFGRNNIVDNLSDILRRLFRIPVEGKPITVVQLMGLPTEVINVIVSVLARLTFDLTMLSEGRLGVTFVCEEAHRYIPRIDSNGFAPTKRALARIAREGRKYGASLCIVSQRPGDLDPTILSQCSTMFTMRLSNENDQDIIRSALADSSASLLEFLPTLATRETIVFGEGVPLPSRIILGKLPPEALPKSASAEFSKIWDQDIVDAGFLRNVIGRWRQTASKAAEQEMWGAEESPLQQAMPPEPAQPEVMHATAGRPQRLQPAHGMHGTQDPRQAFKPRTSFLD